MGGVKVFYVPYFELLETKPKKPSNREGESACCCSPPALEESWRTVALSSVVHSLETVCSSEICLQVINSRSLLKMQQETASMLQPQTALRVQFPFHLL